MSAGVAIPADPRPGEGFPLIASPGKVAGTGWLFDVPGNRYWHCDRCRRACWHPEPMTEGCCECHDGTCRRARRDRG